MQCAIIYCTDAYFNYLLKNKFLIQGEDTETMMSLVQNTLEIIDEFCNYLSGIQVEYKQYMYELRCIR